ncbi:MAG: ABC transporter transmembrane domain-containing protein [Acidimicrobiia bacterium]
MIVAFGHILQFWKPHKALGLGLVITMILRAVFSVALALAIKLVIDEVIEPTANTPVWSIAAFLAVGFFISLTAGMVAARLTATATSRIIADARLTAFRHLQLVPLRFLDRSGDGNLIAHFSSDIAQLSQGVIRKPLIGLRSLTAMALYIPVMLLLDVRLAVLTIVTVPAAVYLAHRFAPKSAPALDDEKQKIADVLDEVTGNLSAQKLVRSYGLQPSFDRRFGQRIDALRQASRNAEARIAIEIVISEYAVELTKLAIIVIGAAFAFNGTLDPGSFAAFAAILQEFSKQASILGMDVMPSIKQSEAGIRRIESLLQTPRDETAKRSLAAPSMSSHIEIDDIAFRYHADQPLQLDGVSASIAEQTYVAIVGPNGSGKSSLLNVVLGLYQQERGSVQVDGVDMSAIELGDLRSKVSIAFQDTVIFDASFRDNITLGEEGFSDAELAQAVDASGLRTIVERSPGGLDADLGARGLTLSDGESQRLGVARAVLRDPELLLLDEVASGLDPASEADVLDAIEGLRDNRTIISVTHRLESVKTVDQVIVIEDGRVVETGAFDDLIAAGSHFASMWTKQHGFDVSANGLTATVKPDRLRAIPLFANLSDAALGDLAAVFESQVLSHRELAFRQGELGDSFYVIARGAVEVVRNIDTSDEEVVAYLDDGDFFGEMALLSAELRNASIRSRGTTTLLRLERRSFNQLLATNPEAKDVVHRAAAERAAANAAGAGSPQ